MNILIINLHSARNLGDDAIMYETIEGLKEVFPSARLTLAATDPDSWRKYCYNENVKLTGSLTTWIMRLENGRWRVRLSAAFIHFPLLVFAVLLYRFLHIKFLFGDPGKRQLLSAYYDADLVISCGGGNFYAHFWISPFFLLSLMALGIAVIMKKRVIMLPQSIGPIQGWPQRWLIRVLLNQVDKIMVREPRSLEFIQKVLRLNKGVLFMHDLAFAPTPIESPSLSFRGAQSGLKVGVTALDRAAQTRNREFTAAQQATYEETLVSALTKISRMYNATIYLFPQCTGPDLAHDDRRVLQRLHLQLRKREVPVILYEEFDSFLKLKTAYTLMDCIIGSRMHTAIFALSLGIPVILIGYQPKSFGIMEYFGLSQFCYDIKTLKSEELISAFSELMENRDRIQQMIQRRYFEVNEQLKKWRHEIVQQ